MTKIPKRPILDWSSFSGERTAGLPSVAELPYRRHTTSGRAAIFQALQAAALPPGSPVLVPTYHCPTMVAPIVLAGLTPIFYPIDACGLPALEIIPTEHAKSAGAIIVPHLFGISQSLGEVRQWCDRFRTVMIEDCAHAYYGMAGDRPIGNWGDFATASLSKYLPVPEGGLLCSRSNPFPSLALEPQGLMAEIRGAFDTVHLATDLGRLKGARLLVSLLRTGRARAEIEVAAPPDARKAASTEDMLASCDMERRNMAPLAVTRWIANRLPQRLAIEARIAHYRTFARSFGINENARPVFSELPANSVPYAFPLWVRNAEPVYHHLRIEGAPIFRWDNIWPTTPEIPGDHGLEWSKRVIQILCHQSLLSDEIDWTVDLVRKTLKDY